MRNDNTKTNAALLVGFCVAAAVFHSLDGIPTDYDLSSSWIEVQRNLRAIKPTNRKNQKQRQLDSTDYDIDPGSTDNAIYPWAEHNLKSLTETLDPDNETPLFWHIPKSGGTTSKAIFECLGMTMVSRAGADPRFGHDHDEELILIKPHRKSNASYINVDTTTELGILRAEKLGLVPSGLADVIIAAFPAFAVSHLYDEDHKGRAFVIFRHPLERLVSKFYYLQVADWEETYSPSWKNMDINYWANSINRDNNSYVKFLAGKRVRDPVDEHDLQIAMRTLKERFVVGLIDEMEESFRRFFVVMGIDESNQKRDECRAKFFGDGGLKKNSNEHPEVKEGSPEWDALAERNTFDVRLYDYIQVLFNEQKEVIETLHNP